MCVLLWAGIRAIKHLYRQWSATGWLCDRGDNGRSDGASPYRPAGDGTAVVGVIAAGADAWLKEITAQARTSPAKMFSVSVPLNHLYSPDQAFEQLVAAAIEGVEIHGWQLESVSTYGAALAVSLYEPDPSFWALLVFRTTYHGRGVEFSLEVS